MATITKKSNQERLTTAKKLWIRVNDQLSDMQTIAHGGFMFDNDTLRLMLKNNWALNARWETLQSRKAKLERLMWKF